MLLVERASTPTEDDRVEKSDAQSGKDYTSSMPLVKEATVARDFNERSKTGALPASERIAARLGVDYEFPPHLECVSSYHSLLGLCNLDRYYI